MKVIAAVRGSNEACFREIAEPDGPECGELLLRTKQLGVCGTDREILLSGEPAVPPGSEFLALGHECLAEVVGVGAGCDGWTPGRLAVPIVRRPLPGFRRRPDMLALGQFTERGILYEHGFSAPLFLDRSEFLVPVPPDLESLAVLTEPMAVAEKGVREADALQRARLGDTAWPAGSPRVAVTGLGPIAYASLLACGARGWPVSVLGRDEPDSVRARLVRELGARYLGAVEWQCETRDVESDGFDLILECTGSDEVLVRSSGRLASCGVLVWLGSSRVPEIRPLPLDHMMRNAVLGNHLHLGSVNAARVDFERAVAHLSWWRNRNAAAVSRILTEHVPVDESLACYARRTPHGIKCVVHHA
ncbi:MAG: hypothetical protein FJ297_17210 [Planctomycetes bacterium]|nr:hypothetical protein [Planctomycetota bacterium]